MQEKFLNMLKLQLKLNDETNGKNWRLGRTKEGKQINWYRCIYMESAELLASFDWKHWKSTKDDYDNAKIELVDIFHFILSLYLEKEEDLLALSIKLDLLSSSFPFKAKNKALLIKLSEELIHKSSAPIPDIDELCLIFFKLCQNCFCLDELYKLYMAKNILNKFRQDRGYKQGNYIKIWLDEGKEKEDNEVLKELLDKELKMELLYEKLAQKYEQSLASKG